MLRILLVRHGETDWNRERRIMGRKAIPLNETGRGQALRLKESMGSAAIDTLYTSPILRAVETAEILCQERDLDPVQDARLEEVHYGDWVGMSFKEARATPGYIPYYEQPNLPVAPNGESLQEVRNRANDFINELKTQRPDQTVVVVSHADWIKCLIMELLEIPFKNVWKFRIDNVSVSLLECDPRGSRVICINQRGDFDRLFVTRFSF